MSDPTNQNGQRRAIRALKERVNKQLSNTKITDYKQMHEQTLISSQGARVLIEGRKEPLLNFSSNNYLGLATSPELLKASSAAIDERGLGAASARFICGTFDIHRELEGQIARFHNQEAAILYASCFDANVGLFDAFLTADDVVLSDSLNHASIIDGIRLCRAKRLIYNHLDLQDLEDKLASCKDANLKLIATDGVFSMNGEVAPLREICNLAEKYEALVFIDECHATGIIGKTGRGSEEYCDTICRVDIINSSLGKALGGASGGYTTGCKELIDLLRQKSRPYIFSSTLSSSVVAAASKAFDMLLKGCPLLKTLHENARAFRKGMLEAGFELIPSDHPLIAVLTKERDTAERLERAMLDENVLVSAMSFPVVPKGQARIRVVISACHSPADVRACVDAFVVAANRIGLELNARR
ncbi:2-amino-3-ketobutyrate coenzyme A ligase, mitochondrial-like isoform X2 [Oscarella lobularis]|uniref:2-amino-3-ketobutyrate coenzyme A ligase, mitochondrial-like isoform X2 n=1 Tax=Oscarella lobularis TaxID=121494 RepID=UPI003313F3AA